MNRRTITVVKRAGPFEVGPIEVFASGEDIGARLDLEQFLALLAANLPRPLLLYRHEKILEALKRATEGAVLSLKQETRKVAK